MRPVLGRRTQAEPECSTVKRVCSRSLIMVGLVVMVVVVLMVVRRP
jgi:hypothetical protein